MLGCLQCAQLNLFWEEDLSALVEGCTERCSHLNFELAEDLDEALGTNIKLARYSNS